MSAGIANKSMSMEDVVALMDAAAPKLGRPKTYKRKALPVQ